MTASDDIPAPLTLHRCTVRPEWVDHNGHMNLGFYSVAYYEASDALSDFLGFTREHKDATNTANFAANMHIAYRREVRADDPLVFRTRVIGCDEKRVHVWHEMCHEAKDYVASTCEMLSLHIDKTARRVAPMAAHIHDWIRQVQKAHSALPTPNGLGLVIKVS